MGPKTTQSQVLFTRLVLVIFGYALAYSVLYFFLGARLTACMLLSGCLVFTPLLLILDRKGFHDTARLGLVSSGLYYIYSTAFGIHHPMYVEFYYIAALVVPEIVFETDKRWHRLSAALLCPLVWMLEHWGPLPEFSAYWIPTQFPAETFQVLNFFGASIIVAVFLAQYARANSALHSELQKTQEWFEEAQSVARLGSWIHDVDLHQTRWSKQMYKIFNLSPSEPVPDYSKLVSLVPPEDSIGLRSTVRACLNVPLKPHTVRFRLAFPDREIWIESIASAIPDDTGRVKEIRGTCQDITERIRAEEESRFVLEAIGIGLWKYTPSSNQLHWDKGMHELYGTTDRDFQGTYKIWEQFLKEGTKDEKEFGTTFTIVTPSGSTKTIGAKAKVIRNAVGEPLVIYGMNWDKTEEMTLLQSLELEKSKSYRASKLASLGELSAGVAHEINNPLAIIAGACEILVRNPDDPSLRTRLETIKKATARIAKIVSGLKKFSRQSELGKRERHSLTAIVREAISLTEPKSLRANTPVSFESHTEEHVMCDEIEIEQVLVNLINNAIDAASKHESKWVRIHAKEESGQLLLQIEDSGPGLPPEVVNKLFQPFFTTKAVGEGTGLGLSISKGILEDHHATIALLETGLHTCFEIRFPKAEEQRHAA